MSAKDKNLAEAPSIKDVVVSVLAGMFGVQSNRKREQDFTQGKPSRYILVGVMMTALFVLMIWGVVTLVLKLAGF